MKVPYAVQWVLSLIFIVQMYLVMVVLAVVFLIPMLLSKRWAMRACHTYCAWVIWTARWIIGLKTQVRGTVPTGQVMVAAKHQSFFDIIIIFGCLPRPKFIMKKELMWAPILGQYAYRLGCVPVDRGGRAEAVTRMLADVQSGRALPGQLCIYPQGTRVAPGVQLPYKKGTAILYKALNQPCVPTACNVGVLWPKRGIYRARGTAVVEFLDPIAPGMDEGPFMARLEDQIETRSDALMAEAGFEQN